MFTESPIDFGFDPPSVSKSEGLWGLHIQYYWQIAFKSVEVSLVFCDFNADHSGFERTQTIEGTFLQDGTGGTIPVYQIYNKDDKTCFMTHANNAVDVVNTYNSLSATRQSQLTVQPLTPSTKMNEGIVDHISGQIAGTAQATVSITDEDDKNGGGTSKQQSGNPVQFGAVFCPGVAETKSGAQAVGQHTLSTILSNPQLVSSNNFFYFSYDRSQGDPSSSLPPRFEFWAINIQKTLNDWESVCLSLLNGTVISGDENMLNVEINGVISGQNDYCVYFIMQGMAMDDSVCIQSPQLKHQAWPNISSPYETKTPEKTPPPGGSYSAVEQGVLFSLFVTMFGTGLSLWL